MAFQPVASIAGVHFKVIGLIQPLEILFFAPMISTP
jgi:hypothetical protein